MAESAHDAIISYTIFADLFPKEKTERFDVPWSEFVGNVRNAATYIDKAHCPLISLCEYGDELSPSDKHPILRHADNVRRAFGCEFDYDGGQMGIDQAAELLSAANIRAVLYTSASHKSDRPRWRALLPFSEAALPEKRAEYVARANRILGGIASRESFALSQSFYIGRVAHAQYEVRETTGRCIDLAADIDPLYGSTHADNGTATRDETTDAQLRAAFDRGTDRYDAMMKLSARWASRGMPADDIESSLMAMLGTQSLNADGVDLRSRCKPLAESAVRKFGETRDKGKALLTTPEPPKDPAPTLPPRAPLEWMDLKGREPPARQWIVPHWIPASHLTLLAGRGGVGKTLLAQHLGAAIATGRDYLEPIAKRRVLMWACEDDHDELWRRQLLINRLLQLEPESLDGQFILHSYVGRDVTLMAPAFGALEVQPMLDELTAQVKDYGADVVMLDNIARLYGGNENDRHCVTTFCALVQGACAPAAVLLLGHPAKQVGSEFSGSTAWEGAVRARLYFSDRLPDAPIDDDAPVDDTVRYLSRRKANYSALDVRKMSLIEGALMPETLEPAARQYGVSGDYVKEIVRGAITVLAGRGLYGALSTASPNYLPKLAKQYSLLDRANEKQFGAAMRAMVIDGQIASEPVGRYNNRSPKLGLVVKR